jgi:hypothetical protein
MQKYDGLLTISKQIWDESTAGGGYTYKKKEMEGNSAISMHSSDKFTNKSTSLNNNKTAAKPSSSQSMRKSNTNNNQSTTV